jgi:oxidoreductase
MSELAGARPDGAGTRVALIGLGWAARTIWLPRFERSPGWTVAALVDPDPWARAQAPEVPGAALLADPADLRPEEIDLAVVAVPNHAHAAVACGLLRRGLPVFLEKPVCLSSADARELARAERAGGAVLLAGSAARHRTDVRELAALVPSLGRIGHVHAAWQRATGVPGSGWFTRRATAGGGALVDLGWHLLDTVLPLLGEARMEQVAAAVGDDFVNRAAARAAWKEEADGEGSGDVEDTVRAFLVTDDGVSVSLHAAWASHAARDTTLIEVHGSAGSAALRCTFGFSPNRVDRSLLTVSRDGAVSEVPLPQEPIGIEYDRQVAELPRLLADPREQGTAVDEALRAVDIVERVYASARRSRARQTAAAPA